MRMQMLFALAYKLYLHMSTDRGAHYEKSVFGKRSTEQ